MNPRYLSNAVERARALADSWAILVKRIKRKYGYAKLPYFCVFERTKKGEPHLHILLRCKWLDQRWLSAQMDDLMHAPIVDIRRITDANHRAHYVTKYVGKEPERFAKCKRYWKSQDYTTPDGSNEEPDERPEGWWDILDYQVGFYADFKASIGCHVEIVRDRYVIRQPQSP